jgi:hypothetical protein
MLSNSKWDSSTTWTGLTPPFLKKFVPIVNGNAQDYRREHTLSLKDDRGLQLKLQLHYFKL